MESADSAPATVEVVEEPVIEAQQEIAGGVTIEQAQGEVFQVAHRVPPHHTIPDTSSQHIFSIHLLNLPSQPLIVPYFTYQPILSTSYLYFSLPPPPLLPLSPLVGGF